MELQTPCFVFFVALREGIDVKNIKIRAFRLEKC